MIPVKSIKIDLAADFRLPDATVFETVQAKYGVDAIHITRCAHTKTTIITVDDPCDPYGATAEEINDLLNCLERGNANVRVA